MLEPYCHRIWENHEQKIERLAAKGGLRPSEIIAILEDRDWTPVAETAAAILLKEILAKSK
jgi:hypothetical protein